MSDASISASGEALRRHDSSPYRVLLAEKGFRIARIILGLILFVSGSLKAEGLFLEAGAIAPTNSLPVKIHWVLFFGELALAVWLWVGAYRRLLWIVTFVVFGGFVLYTLLSALRGSASCGCFGPLQTNPWIMVCIDVAVVTAWFACRPLDLYLDRTAERRSQLDALLSFVPSALLCSLIVGIGIVWFASRGSENEPGIVQYKGDVVLLEPEKWIAQRFPLLRYTDISDSILEGDWVVILFHHDCPKCQSAIARYEHEVESAERGGSTFLRRVALIEVPPFNSTVARARRGIVSGRLVADKTWTVRTPIYLMLTNGYVTSAATDP